MMTPTSSAARGATVARAAADAGWELSEGPAPPRRVRAFLLFAFVRSAGGSGAARAHVPGVGFVSRERLLLAARGRRLHVTMKLKDSMPRTNKSTGRRDMCIDDGDESTARRGGEGGAGQPTDRLSTALSQPHEYRVSESGAQARPRTMSEWRSSQCLPARGQRHVRARLQITDNGHTDTRCRCT